MLSGIRDEDVGERLLHGAWRAALVAVAGVAVGAANLGWYLSAAGQVPAQVFAAPVLAAPAPTPTSAAAALVFGPPVPSAAPGAKPTPAAPAPSVYPASQTCDAPTTVTPASVVSRGDRDRKVVALTFDDGTDADNTRDILRILERERVNATFFPTGRSMDRFPTLWRNIARAGFPIANHTYAHSELSGQCYNAQRRELARATEVFARLGIAQFPVMRPPYELWDDTTPVAATAEGMRAVVLWNVDTKDWAGASAATIKRRALAGGKGSIVLLHTSPEKTVKALPGIIEGYRDRGYEFVTIGQLLGIDGAVPYPPEDD